MAANFDIKGFLNSPEAQANKPAAIKYLQSKGVIDERGNLIDSTQPAQPTTGSAGQAIVPGSTLGSNLKALPGQLLDAGKSLFKTITAGAPAIGESLGTAALNIDKLAHGQNPDIPVDIPKTIGGYIQAGSTVSGIGALKGTKAAIDVAKGIGAVGNDATHTAQIVDTVAPKLTAAESAKALAARGGTKTGILGTIKTNVDPAVARIADTVKQLVPDFNPSKSLVENINATKATVSTLADELKRSVIASGKDRIYSFKELGSTLKSLPKPTLLVGDAEKVYSRVITKAMEIARSNGGKVSDLFQARKEFDQFVSDAIPNLYSSDTQTAMRIAIRNVRNAMTDFTAEHLPDIGLRDSLTNQSRLIDAIENMSEKAASGASKEVGTNILGRASTAIKQHPVASTVAGVTGGDFVLRKLGL